MSCYGLAGGVVFENPVVVHGVDPVDAGWLGSAEALHMIPCGLIRLVADDVARTKEISVTRVH